MPFDEHTGDQHDHDSAQRPGVARRSTLAAAWSTPVIAACAAAPGAAASVSPSPVLPETFLGVRVIDAGLVTTDLGARRRFEISVFVNGDGITGTPIVLRQEGRVDFRTDHDFTLGSTQVVRVGPRGGYILIPAGSYAGSIPYSIGGVMKVAALVSGAPYPFVYSDPPQRAHVEVMVTGGPAHPGTPAPGTISTREKDELTTD
ncbi:hypothetical protein EDF36_2010 [Rathayibacter sp. PhB152]|uniref:hypothetical protein n=1 Tax=Rathayibacter sp. PhB152 TaxID=2485190 RepID=UPI000F4B3109|nr:hypothetical protein [Rathayibacter sp. PhB152]ROQ58566.1 hypothetical protein EDF36_2010 [Rathayibacter sp. PhB152]